MSWPPKISPYSQCECVNGRSSSPRPDPSDGLPQAGLLAASSTRGGVPHHIGPCLGQAVGPMSWPPKISPYSHFECVNGRGSSPRPDPSDGLPQAGLLAASSTRGGVPHHIGPCLGQAVGPMSWPPKISPHSHFECVNGRSSSPRPDPSDGFHQAGLLAASFTRGGVPHHIGPCLGQAVGPSPGRLKSAHIAISNVSMVEVQVLGPTPPTACPRQGSWLQVPPGVGYPTI